MPIHLGFHMPRSPMVEPWRNHDDRGIWISSFAGYSPFLVIALKINFSMQGPPKSEQKPTVVEKRISITSICIFSKSGFAAVSMSLILIEFTKGIKVDIEVDIGILEHTWLALIWLILSLRNLHIEIFEIFFKIFSFIQECDFPSNSIERLKNLD